MAKWLQRSLLLAMALLITLGGCWLLLARAANADAESVPAELARASFERSVAWLRHNEQKVLADGNAALWWMVSEAASRSGDPDLHALVTRSIELAYGGANATSPWRRLVEPGAQIELRDHMLNGLQPYQRFYYFSATCREVEPDQHGVGSRQFVDSNMCQPMWRKVFLTDTVCSTHQLLGIRMARRTGCPLDAKVAGLESELVQDIHLQLSLDPIFRDAYIQRVLSVYWVAGPQQVKPVWLRRVLQAQRADGGWSGDRLLLGLPGWLQPFALRQWFARFLPERFSSGEPESEFHATAQGMLLMALAMGSTSPSVSDR